jgi:hypothetical protein
LATCCSSTRKSKSRNMATTPRRKVASRHFAVASPSSGATPVGALGRGRRRP